MKIRTSFVSNSSSSSFLAVVTDYMLDDLLDKMGWDKDEDYLSYGTYENPDSSITLYGYCHEPEFYGLNIRELLEDNRSLTEIKTIFHNIVQQTYNISIPPSRIKLDFGEVGD